MIRLKATAYRTIIGLAVIREAPPDRTARGRQGARHETMLAGDGCQAGQGDHLAVFASRKV